MSLFKVKFFIFGWSPHTILVGTVFYFPTYVLSLIFLSFFSFASSLASKTLAPLSLHNFLPLFNHRPLSPVDLAAGLLPPPPFNLATTLTHHH